MKAVTLLTLCCAVLWFTGCAKEPPKPKPRAPLLLGMSASTVAVQATEEGELVRGLPIRIHLLREGASAHIQLGEKARFYPSDAALASWMAQAHDGQARIVYE